MADVRYIKFARQSTALSLRRTTLTELESAHLPARRMPTLATNVVLDILFFTKAKYIF